MTPGPRPRPLAERFWPKVDKTPTCWLWTGGIMSAGYGMIGRGARSEGTALAHRVAWELAIGPLDASDVLDHKCHTRACVRPSHLHVVTHALNNQNRSGAQSNSTTGVRGVYWSASRRKYVVETKAHGRKHYGGEYADLADARAAAIALRTRVMTNNLADREVPPAA